MRRSPVCYICGEETQNPTKDHVIPRCLFPTPPPPNLITLPCHSKCQEKYAKDEEYFRTHISVISNLGENANAREVWKKALRGLKQRPHQRTDLINRLDDVDIQTPGGLYIGKAKEVKFSAKRTNRILYKIARGLFTFHTGKILPRHMISKFYFKPKDYQPQLLKLAKYSGRFSNIFSYSCVMDEGGSSIWWLVFYQSVHTIVAFVEKELLK